MLKMLLLWAVRAAVAGTALGWVPVAGGISAAVGSFEPSPVVFRSGRKIRGFVIGGAQAVPFAAGGSGTAHEVGRTIATSGAQCAERTGSAA